MRPVVTIVGRPNVGKSTLFNRWIGQRRAIVHDTPGVTRDRIFALAPLGEKTIWLVDTGGLEPGSQAEMADVIHEQVEKAASEANLLLIMFDGREGIVPADQKVVAKLRRLGKPVIGVVNKVDPETKKASSAEFNQLGIKNLVEISAEHNRGIGTLQEMVEEEVASLFTEEGEVKADQTRVAFIGRPNVGKSSLINAILDESRLAVSNIPGTTRDVTDTPVEHDGSSYLLLDTAGIRKQGKQESAIEYYSVVRALHAIDRADVVVCVVDASEGITTQDARIASAAMEKGSGLLVAVNKWDLKDDRPSTRTTYREDLYLEAPFLRFADVRFVSAKSRMGIDRLLPRTRQIFRSLKRKYSQSELDRIFREITSAHSQMGQRGFRLQIKNLTAAEERIPTFFVWCNDPRLVDEAYERYWRNMLGEKLHLVGVPLRVVFRRKQKRRRK